MGFSVVVAGSFANASGTATCNTTISYGGGECDPDADGKAVYEQVNVMRAQTGLWKNYIDHTGVTANTGSLFTEACSVVGGIATCKAKFNGTTGASRTYVRGTTNLTAVKDALNGAGILSAMEWAPGLFKAAKAHATDMASTSPVVTTGNDGSTLATRVAKFGTAGSGGGLVENLQATTDSAQWVVLDMLVSDTDSSNASRSALLSSTIN